MSINLKTDSISKSFLQYLLPALTGMVIKSLFIMGDAFFIGQGVGPEGLGAISLAVPTFSFFSALAMMIGIGGAAMMSIEVGKGSTKLAQTLFSQSMLIAFLLSTLFVSISYLSLEEIISLVGAEGLIASLTYEYLSILLVSFIPFSLCWVMSAFVRNDSNPNLAMYAMSGGAVINLVLDYIFVIQFDWGMKGAALGTGLSQLVILTILLGHFISKKGNLKLNLEGLGFDFIKPILSIGLPIFFIEVTSAITIILFNYVLLESFGDSHVIAYGLTSSLGVFALFIVIGITQACQPIISFNYGSEQLGRVKETLKIGMMSAIGAGVFLFSVVLISSHSIAAFYLGEHSELIKLASLALLCYFSAAPLMAYNMVVANLFQATAKPAKASVISVARGFVFVVLGLMLLPKLIPENGVWFSILFAESITAVISSYMLYTFLTEQNRVLNVER